MTALEELRAARALIDTPEKWTQGAYALDANGKSTDPKSDVAVCFCISGAFWRIDWDKGAPDGFSAFKRAAGRYPVDFNDDPGTTHADILAAFDKAIAAEQAS